jgi:hypothetical protein
MSVDVKPIRSRRDFEAALGEVKRLWVSFVRLCTHIA